jgi:hypothetical protein
MAGDTVNHVTIIEDQLRVILAVLAAQNIVLADIQAKVDQIVADKIVGIGVNVAPPVPRPEGAQP